jgi:hypothetical protein
MIWRIRVQPKQSVTKKKPKELLFFKQLADDGRCLRDADVHAFYEGGYSRGKLVVHTRRALVETKYSAGLSKEQTVIKVTPVLIRTMTGSEEVHADVVTGTLYYPTGECLSSSNRRVIKWEK